MTILFNSRNRQFKEPFGCIEANDILKLQLYCKDAGETGVLFLLEADGEEPEAFQMTYSGMQEGYRVYQYKTVMQKPGLYFYCFCLQWENGQNERILKGQYNEPCIGAGEKWQLTCYSGEQTPKSFYGQVMYQIFPDRFHRAGNCDTKDKLTPFYIHQNPREVPAFLPNAEGKILNHDFFGGNFAGMIEKLPYLQALGVQILYLNPIFMAYSNHRYDTADYKRVDPLLGTNEDFKALCEAAHRFGMRVILDGVFSHTGSDSRYFDVHNRFGGGAYHNPDSPYRPWYQFQQYPQKYTSWWGIETLPCVEEKNSSYQNFIISGENSVVKHWQRLGADGWRLDVADELPDDFLFRFYETVKQEKPESIVIGEVWEDASNKISYGNRRHYLQGGCLDSVMNYVWREAIIRFVRREMSAADMEETVMTICEHYPPAALHTMMNSLSTHDTARILTVLGAEHVPQEKEARATFCLSQRERALAKERLFVAAFLAFTLPGCPCIYYGDEIGMEGFEDPFNRAYMGNREQDAEILTIFQSLAALKQNSPALRQGFVRKAFAGEGVYAFYRTQDGERVLCVVNVANRPYSLFLPKGQVLHARCTQQKDDEVLLLPYGSIAVSVTETEIGA